MGQLQRKRFLTSIKYSIVLLPLFIITCSIQKLKFPDRGSEGITISQTVLNDTIPFKLTSSNNIVIEAVINKIDTVDLMFHTAESSISIIKSKVDSLASFNPTKTLEGIQTWGGDATTKYALDNSIKIGSFKKDSITIFQTGLSGPGTDGKFGPNFFEDKIIELDFDNSKLIIHNKLPSKASKYNAHKLRIERESMLFIDGNLRIENDIIPHSFLIHSGYASNLLLDDEFVNNHKLNNKLKTLSVAELKDSHGNIIKTKKAILPSLELGEYKLNQLPIGFFAGSIGRQKMSILGGDLIRRFNMIIHISDSMIYLKPNANYNLEYYE